MSTVQPHFGVKLIVLATITVLIGACGRSNEVANVSRGAQHFGADMLSENDARQALVDMVENTPHQSLKMALPNLKTDPVTRINDHLIEIGQWRIDLQGETFVVSVVAPPVFEEYRGEFKHKPDGRWEAKIQSERRT